MEKLCTPKGTAGPGWPKTSADSNGCPPHAIVRTTRVGTDAVSRTPRLKAMLTKPKPRGSASVTVDDAHVFRGNRSAAERR